MTISELLTAANKEHDLYRASVPHRRAQGGVLTQVVGSLADAQAHMVEARRLRLEADAQDPQHTDQAWQSERPSLHAGLLAFYAEQLDRVQA